MYWPSMNFQWPKIAIRNEFGSFQITPQENHYPYPQGLDLKLGLKHLSNLAIIKFRKHILLLFFWLKIQA